MLMGPKHVLEITVSSNSHWHFPVCPGKVNQLTGQAEATATLGTQLPLSALCDDCASHAALGRGPKPVLPSLWSCVPATRLENDTCTCWACCRWSSSWNKLYRRTWAETRNHQRGEKGIIQKENNYSTTEICKKKTPSAFWFVGKFEQRPLQFQQNGFYLTKSPESKEEFSWPPTQWEAP